MTIWSALRTIAVRQNPKPSLISGLTRSMSGGHARTFPLQPSRWQWMKFKDYFHYYIMLGAIPLSAVSLVTNVFIGPATLSEIPEGYTPKYWEYYRHPISRFIARYILTDPQQDYEKFLHLCFEEEERKRIRQLESEIKEKMRQRQDYQAYYYRPVTSKYHKIERDSAARLHRASGE